MMPGGPGEEVEVAVLDGDVLVDDVWVDAGLVLEEGGGDEDVVALGEVEAEAEDDADGEAEAEGVC
jgi:hypothetical protein